MTTKSGQSSLLLFWGISLFLLGLIVGFFVPLFETPRLGLSSHIEGVMNGMLLMILGLMWKRVELSPRWLSITFWLALYGTFANWFGILLAALFNAGGMLGIAAEGQVGTPMAEAAVAFFLVTLSIAMVTVCITLLIGLFRHMKSL